MFFLRTALGKRRKMAQKYFDLVDCHHRLKCTWKLHAEGSIQIEQTGLFCEGEDLLTVLWEFTEYVSGLVNYFGRTFFGE
jgi:hypothetical protein